MFSSGVPMYFRVEDEKKFRKTKKEILISNFSLDILLDARRWYFFFLKPKFL